MFYPNGGNPERDMLAQVLSAISMRNILHSTGLIPAATVVAKHLLSQGNTVITDGIGSGAPLSSIFLRAQDYPAMFGLVPKFSIRVQLYTNDVAPAANFTFGLYPFTRPGVSGGAGVTIYTIGVVTPGSNGAAFAAPAADGLLNAVSAEFDFPAAGDGHYAMGVDLAGGATAANSYVSIAAQLGVRYIRP